MGIHSAAAAVESVPLSSDAVTYAAAFQATAARVPDRPALRTARDRTHLTWAQYASAVERTAGALAGLESDAETGSRCCHATGRNWPSPTSRRSTSEP